MRKVFFTFKRICLTILCFLTLFIAYAQGPSVQDCIGAIPVCRKIYDNSASYLGAGDIIDFRNDQICMAEEENSVWYTFQVNNSGQFGFLITPRDVNDDYDWALFDITNATCEDINRDPARYRVSCNSAGGETCDGMTGASGATSYDIQGRNCGNEDPDFSKGFSAINDLIDVQRGNVYVLVVNNWSNDAGSRSGYTIDFGLSTNIGIIDEEPPFVAQLDLVSECSGEEIMVQFSERIQCATLDAANFSLDGPNGNIPLSLFSQECANGYVYGEYFILRPETPISAKGDYTLTVDLNGSTEALDICNNPSSANEYILPNPVEDPVVDLGSDITQCTGQGVELTATGTSGNSYEWSTGFSGGPVINVSEPGTYRVTVTTNCGQATDEIEVNFSDGPPVIDIGEDRLLCPTDTITLNASTPGATYLWQDGANEATYVVDKTGTYSVTVTTKCGTTTDRITFNYGEANLALDLGEDQRVCPSDEGVSVDATVFQDQAVYAWSDGFSEPTRNITQSGIYEVSVTTICGSVSDTIEIDFIGDGDELVELGEDLIICPNENAILDATVPDAVYAWQDGSFAATYTASETGLYKVTVTNECVAVVDSIYVTVRDEASINLAPDTVICEGDILALDVSLDDPNASYSWQNGTLGPNFQIDQAGNYTVTVTDDCGEVIRSIEVSYFDSLNVVVPNDTIVCPGDQISIVPSGNALDFIWPDGSNGASFEVSEPGRYTFLASNECEEVSFDVVIDECVRCEFYVPNAISPNDDGNNDVFMPYTSFECPIDEYNLQIFDRWGSVVHETNSLEEGWSGYSTSGTKVPVGVYIYVVNLTVLENGQPKSVVLNGSVTMTR